LLWTGHLVLHTSSTPQGWVSTAAGHHLISPGSYKHTHRVQPRGSSGFGPCSPPMQEGLLDPCGTHVMLLSWPFRAPQAARHWWDSPEAHQMPGGGSGPGLRCYSHTYSIPSQGCVFEEFFPSETQPEGKVRKPPHESWSETFRQDISPLECAGSSRCFVETA